MLTQVLAYVPVIHQGYLRFFQAQASDATIGIFERDLTHTFEPVVKDIRALAPEQIVATLKTLLPEREIQLINRDQLIKLNTPAQKIVLPDEDISHKLANEFLPTASISFESVFLRWDRARMTAALEPSPDQTISMQQFQDRFMQQFQDGFMQQAAELATRSADWWRQVGAVLVKDGQPVLEAINHHLPHHQQPYIDGDPRANFHKGEYIELTTAIHAEASIIAQAAKAGVAVVGASLYVSTFPCPVCAKLIAESGIAEVYYADGYAMLDGETILKNRNVKVIVVSRDLSPA